MNLEILWRLLWTLAIVIAGIIFYYLVNYVLLRQARSQRLALPHFGSGRPVLVYFTTPTCAPCKTVQRPAIQQLKTLMGDCLDIIEIDAASQPEVASQWGVLSVPTTIVLDYNGQPQHVNHGVATYEKLVRQMGGLRPGG